jgi:putative hemolysin
LIVGELVPKRLALNNPERIASFVARPMKILSTVALPVVRFLEISTQVVLKILRVRPSTEPPVTEEEIKVLIEQGTQAGVFEEAEQNLVESLFRLGDRRITALMTPRLDVVWLDVNAPFEENRRKAIDSQFSRFPVGDGSLDNLLGVVKVKTLLADVAPDLKSLLKQPLFVPETRSALQVLDLFKTSHTHLALIIDEYGAVEGLVTTNDILEAIVGEITATSAQAESYAVQREDGSWLLDGMLAVEDFEEIFPSVVLPPEEKGLYQTLAGFVLRHLGRVPATADHFEWNGLRFEIIDMDGKRVDKILVMKLSDESEPSV